MKILVFDSTSDALAVVLDTDGKMDFEISSGGKKSHASEIVSLADTLLERNNLSISDIDCIGAVTGPGSFTGIRIGVATANALSYGTGAKRLQINAFEPMIGNRKDCVCVIDALHSNYYAATVRDGQTVSLGYLTEEEVLKTGLKKVERTVDETYVESLAAVARKKAECRDFADNIVPLYLRKSQAEREAEANGRI